jgi:hypothetical protein
LGKNEGLFSQDDADKVVRAEDGRDDLAAVGGGFAQFVAEFRQLGRRNDKAPRASMARVR